MNRPPLAHKVRIDYVYHDATTHEADPNAFRERMRARRQSAQTDRVLARLAQAPEPTAVDRELQQIRAFATGVLQFPKARP